MQIFRLLTGGGGVHISYIRFHRLLKTTDLKM